MIASYHNHSAWSDGKGRPEEIVAAAARLGLDEVGLSDHLTIDPAGETRPWSIPPAELDDYVAELLTLRDESSSPRFRVGIEVDWFEGMTPELSAKLDPHPFDYIIGSVHEVGPMVVDGSPAAWDKLPADEQDEIHRGYWRAMVGLAESGLFDIAAHLDLTKKFGHAPRIDLTAEIDDALDAIKEHGLVVEVNTAGWHKPCRDAYPSAAIIGKCHARAIPVTVNADAHQPEHLLRDFGRGLDRLAEAGYTEVVRFRERERVTSLIDAARPRGTR